MCVFEGRPDEKHRVRLAGERIDLVPLAERHLPLVIAWRNDPSIRRRFGNRRVFTMASQLEWFARYALDATAFCFAIARKDGRTIGMIGISKVDWRARSGEFGRFVIGDPLSLGRGYGREAAQLVLGFAESGLQLKSVSLLVFADNEAALRLYGSLGFVEVSTFSREISDGTTAASKRMILTFNAGAGVHSPESDSVAS